MAFYKLEAKYSYTTNDGKRKTKIYKYYYTSFVNMLPQIEYDLSLGAKISAKEIPESVYVKGIR